MAATTRAPRAYRRHAGRPFGPLGPLAALLCLSLSGLPASEAAKLYKWVDADGNISYQDQPPPGNVEFEARQYKQPGEAAAAEVAQNLEAAARAHPVVLYVVPACSVCDLVRLYLEKNAIPFTEKDVQTNLPLQQELQSRAGQLSVPTLFIGELALDGYSKSAIENALKQRGFPLAQPTPSPTTPSPTSAAEPSQTPTESSQPSVESGQAPAVN